jgi:hypothetical protein
MSFPATSAADEIEAADLAGNRRLGQSQHEFGHHCNSPRRNATMRSPRVPKHHPPFEQVPIMLPRRSLQCVFSLGCCGILLTWLSVAETTPTIAAAVDEPAKKDDTATKEAFFREKVLPLLESRCFECHGPDSDARWRRIWCGDCARKAG